MMIIMILSDGICESALCQLCFNDMNVRQQKNKCKTPFVAPGILNIGNQKSSF